ALLGAEVRGEYLERAFALLSIRELDAEADLEHVLKFLVHHHREQRRGVLVLLLRHSGQLDKRVRVGAGNRLAILVPPNQTTRTDKLRNAQERGQGVFAGALDPDETCLTEDGVAGLRVERIPPQDEPLL